jgi:hypothetical protein
MSKDTKSHKIFVDLVGGIGNQLFGLVFGLALSNKTKAELFLDTSFIGFGSNKSRKLEIEQFIFSNNTIKYSSSKISNFPILTNYNFSKKIIQKTMYATRRTIKESASNDHLKNYSRKHFSGYFQNWMYADYLIQADPKFSIEIKKMEESLSVFEKQLVLKMPIIVHVRLGDYLIHKDYFSILPENYYIKAIEIMLNQNPNSPVWLIVESLEELKKTYPKLFNLPDKIIHQRSHIKDHEIFYLMCKSKLLIASNSTFSLWPSWFVLNSGGKVIVPSEFKVNGQNSDLIDGRWDSLNIEDFSFKNRIDLDQVRLDNYKNYIKLFN